MNLYQISEMFELIAEGTQSVSDRRQTIKIRKNALNSITYQSGFTKNAFDTRRINQETDIIPRRGLQNYNRSEAFLSEAMGEKLKNFSRLKKILSSLKSVYGKEPEWQDSNARILLSTLEKGLRSDYQDGDYTEAQPGTGSLDYIEELLHVRYRLGFDDLCKMADQDLKKAILAKDENLIRQDVNRSLEITKSDVANQSYDLLLDKLIGNVRASADNPDVERIITITIRDKWGK